MAATTNQTALSLRVNELFGAYVTAEAEQARLAESGDIDGADALSGPALAIREEVFAIRDRSGNADLIAARILLDLMLGNYWKNVVPGYEWRFGEVHEELPLLEIVADRTTGSVREQARLALATIGVEVAPEAPDPMLALVREYLVLHHAASVAETDDEADAIVGGDPMGRVFDRFAYDPPAPTTIAGAAAAVRLVHDESNGAYNPALIRNVLAVVADALDGRVA